ncbi:phenylalanyl-tRNA synthetase beta subunit [Alkalithermobacter thermoalcaliphilus JW-YL-7 = DSM 7308]|uniref:Phenylalanine--tRNA ligase beta subunit n=1 Tax=Alkalithermobacter thermoalcaliphilus JW-YL-7 = DSM 7308 TaxID=1121328 RepID=A0A150FQL9_CLOPD|nr:Phenylalanyl-tRNA synthetase beta chain [[Clostridium] paradoxum JW-YL-7 = DSM 7308]SHK55400.1 phenylalanyl-tRNA synthetase beta subunit [[Clostridium] paradoxum JW-YL-7 = DSM 7308]
MLVPLKWLRDYVDIDIDVKEFADKMTMTGSKVEKIETLGKDIENVVVGKILEITSHPNADKLLITKVDVKENIIQVVTGAKNIKVGDYVPVALVNAKLPGGIKIKKGKLRGEVSEGMMCSHEELGIPANMVDDSKKDGIYILDSCQEVGKDIREVLGINDSILEFEITSNRPDCLSIIGIAREACATLGKKIKYPEINIKESDENIDFKVEIKDEDICKRYAARIVKDVIIKPSPYWMQRRLIEAGIRPINNIVDITNYVMIEMGQPIHAFDLSKIKGEKIIVRKAENKETIKTLDGIDRVLDEEMIVISDEEKAIALAGVMGGLNSEVDENTKQILIESANFNSDKVRYASKKIGLRTEASSRFEKGIDINLVKTALDRVCQLIEQTNSGTVLKGYVDNYKQVYTPKSLVVDPNRINKLLGENLKVDQIIQILESLEFVCEYKDEKISITVPSYRLDIHQEADILEEVARIYGYDKISSNPIFGQTTMGLKTIGQLFEEKIKQSLISMGINEILTYSFVSPKGLDMIKLPETSIKRKLIKIINPLGEDTSVMRSTLIPNIMDVMSRNNSYKVSEFAGFELGNIFIPMQDIIPVEKKSIVVGLYGSYDFFDLKGILEELFENIGFNKYEIIPEKNHPTFHPGRCANIIYNNNIIGVFGEIHPDVLENYDLNKRAYVAELDFELLLLLSRDNKTYKPLPKYPASSRDLAVVVRDDIFVKQIEDIIKENSNGIIESFKLFDVYKGSQIEKGYKSVAYSITYRSENKTLTDDEINLVHNNIVKDLEEKLDAKLRL